LPHILIGGVFIDDKRLFTGGHAGHFDFPFSGVGATRKFSL
jgi:hypothetical protein